MQSLNFLNELSDTIFDNISTKGTCNAYTYANEPSRWSKYCTSLLATLTNTKSKPKNWLNYYNKNQRTQRAIYGFQNDKYLSMEAKIWNHSVMLFDGGAKLQAPKPPRHLYYHFNLPNSLSPSKLANEKTIALANLSFINCIIFCYSTGNMPVRRLNGWQLLCLL